MHALSFCADDGEDLHVWRHGEAGPAIVFLHGWTSSHLEWSHFIHDLALRHRLFRWDARAHGGHPPRTGAVATAARMARDLDNMIDAFDLAGACFVGHSMGALTLWQYLRDHGSAKIGALCCIDQSPKLITDASWDLGIYGDFDAARAARFSADLRRDFAEGVLRLAACGLNAVARAGYEADGRGWQRMRESLRAQPAPALIACWEDLVALDLRDVVPRIDRPCLLVHGGRSNFYRIETAHWLAARVPGARLCIYEEANHSPHLVDPARFMAELTALAPPASMTDE
ncbi:MAG: alpha/beta hydrolase [Rhodocyclaceae bacterium]|nr:alpha/beta hydrolase [Rhodocyclaceae bacterium]